MANRKHYHFDMMVTGGYISDHTFNHKFGASPQMSNGSTGSVWDVDDTVYPWDALAVPAVVNIERNNGSDDGITVTVQGLDENFNYQSEDITISGANTLGTKLFKRVNRAFITEDGDANAGDIDIEAGAAGGTTVARITAGEGQSLMAVYTVPAGKTGYLHKIGTSIEKSGDATMKLFVRRFDDDSSTQPFRIAHTYEVQGDGGAYIYDFPFPLKFEETTDLDVRATMRSNNSRVTATFDILLVDNDE